MNDDPEREALARLRKRDSRGFDWAYDTYAPRVHAFLLRLSQRCDVADDLLQHTFLRLAERGPELHPDSNLRGWLFKVARNAYVSQVRAQHGGDGKRLEVVSTMEPAYEARLLLGDVEQALSRLKLEDREPLLLIGVEGMEPSEVASLLGIYPAAVRQRLLRARARLLAELERVPELARVQAKKRCLE